LVLRDAIAAVDFQFGWMAYADQVFDGSACSVCVIQIALLMLIVRPFESLFPVEEWADRRARE